MTADANVDELPKRALATRSPAFGTSVWAIADRLIGQHEDVIYFGSGSPSRDLYPVDRLREAALTAWSGAATFLDYGEVEGYLPLRQLIQQRMAKRGIEADTAEIMITTGSQQGLDQIAKLTVDPGDLVVVEGPTYIGAMQAFDPYEAEYLTVTVDDEGMNVPELAAKLDRADRTPKFIYTIPNYQNPTGISMTPARRHTLVELARDRGILILEDDPYGEIYFEERSAPPLRALDPTVVYLGTFSKTIAPGIRVGWMVAPKDLLSMLLMAKEATDIHGDRVMMRTVHAAADGFLDDHVERVRAVYKARRDAMLGALAEYMPPDVSWSEPKGGFFVWMTLPDDIVSEDFLPFAASRGVAFLPGTWFYPRGQEIRSSIRLNFSTLDEDRITTGIKRLARAYSEYRIGAE